MMQTSIFIFNNSSCISKTSEFEYTIDDHDGDEHDKGWEIIKNEFIIECF